MEKLSDVAVFVQVVGSGSFTAAAEALGLSKAVVSKYVSRLEDRLGARLLHRTTRRLSLTEVGAAFHDRARQALEAIDEAEQEVSRLQGEPRGTLRLNAPMSFGILHIAPALPGLLARHPGLAVELNLDDRQVDLVAGGYDLAVRIAELPDSTLVARRLAPCRHVVCAAPAYLARHGTPAVPGDLAGHNCLAYRYQDSPREWRFRTPEGRYVAVPVRGDLNANSGLALREAALAGLGIILTPTFTVGDALREGRLVALLPGHATLETAVYAVYPERRHLSPKVHAFIAYFSERFGAVPPWDRSA